MKRWLLAIGVLGVLLVLCGCSFQRLSEDDYAQKAADAYKQGKLNDACITYRLLLSYYPQSPKIKQYRTMFAEVLLKLVQESPEHLAQGYLTELKGLQGTSDTMLAWLSFSMAMKITDKNQAALAFNKMGFNELLLAAQYAINRMRFNDALTAYEKIIEIFPNNPMTYKAAFLAGFVASEYLKDKDRAKKLYALVAEKFPESDLADDAKWMLANMDKSPEEQITFVSNEQKKSAGPKKQK